MSLFERAEEAAFLGNYDAAVELYKRSMAEESDKAASAAIRLFFTYKRLHKYDEAAAAMQDIIRLTGDPSYRAELADLYRIAGKHYEAQGLYQEMLGQNADDGRALYGIGTSLEATGSYDAARDYFSRAATGGGSYAAAARRHLTRIKDAGSLSKIDSDVPVGRWAKNVRPIKIFVEDGADVPEYRSPMRQFVLDAVTAWNNAAHGTIELAIVDSADAANIVVGWMANLDGALGVTQPIVSNQIMRRARIYLSIGTDSQGRALPPESAATRQLYESRDRVLHEVALHELGHALGLHHSPRTQDIMADGIFGMNSADVPSARELQPGDIERLLALYGKEGEPASVAAGTGGGITTQAGTGGGVTVGAGRSSRTAGLGLSPDSGRSPVTPMQRQTGSALSDAMFNLQSGKFEDSKESLTTVLNRDPKNAMAHYLMAITLVNLRNYSAAEQHYKAVLRLSPGGELANRAAQGLAKISKHQN